MRRMYWGEWVGVAAADGAAAPMGCRIAAMVVAGYTSAGVVAGYIAVRVVAGFTSTGVVAGRESSTYRQGRGLTVQVLKPCTLAGLASVVAASLAASVKALKSPDSMCDVARS
jgi:hypothetical protein